MINKWLFLFFFVSVLVVLQAGFFMEVPWLLGFNIVVVYAIVTVVRADYKEAAFVVILSGLLLDLYSGLLDGTLTLSLILSAFLVSFLSRSLLAPYSGRLMMFMAAGIGILSFNLSVLVITLVLSLFNLASVSSVAFAVWSKIWMELITAVVLVPVSLYIFEFKDKILTLLAR